MINRIVILFMLAVYFTACSPSNKNDSETGLEYVSLSENVLTYQITPLNKFDKAGLMFSDQGAWFAYSFPDSLKSIGFSGPFLMTQQNGIWSSESLATLNIKNITWNDHHFTSYNSHLEQVFNSDKIELSQKLVFLSGHTAIIQSTLKNKTNKEVSFEYQWSNTAILADSLQLTVDKNQIKITSSKTDAIGYLLFKNEAELTRKNSYNTQSKTLLLKPYQAEDIIISQSFVFSNYNWEHEKKVILKVNFDSLLSIRKLEKGKQLETIINNRKKQFQDSIYNTVLAKSVLTLQNNWRIPAGEIKHEGLFPTYHYKWFHGFWSWDSWKQAVGLSFYDIKLAKKQIKLMFEFQNDDGFVADVVYRDTTIEVHNYRDTKPPLSAWAVVNIYNKDKDFAFVNYMYPRLKKYHEWWYLNRDHDQDGICEYGSTDGSLIAAKWESGMDNAIRFDNSKILKNSDGAFSLNQESVDLNSYLYAEKLFLADLANIIGNNDGEHYLRQAEKLKNMIQSQFYDDNDEWFYDTNLKGDEFIKGEGSEGWTALWANAATEKQAISVKNNMMDSKKFYTKVPFQTMSADHPKFDPLEGYWRGPNWLDQAYFGVKGLRNYGFFKEADQATIQILKGADGLLEKGMSIRENYHPQTGQGLHAKNFSWSAAHIIMLLSEE